MRLAVFLLLTLACARPDHIEIDPRAPHLVRKGEALRLHARMMDRGGHGFPQERATWTSRDPSIAAVDENGSLTAGSSGHTVVTAKWAELSADVPVEVELVEALRIEPSSLELGAAADPVKLSVAALGPDGHPLRDREVRLVSANPAVARVDREGKVWPVAAGETKIRATADDKAGEIAVRVK